METVFQPVLGGSPLPAPRWRRNGVNWEAYREDVENNLSNVPPCPDLTKRLQRLQNLMLDAAHRHVGKSKPRRHGRDCLTPVVREAF